MLLNTNQKKTWLEISQNYIDSDRTKMDFTDKCVFKVINRDAENDIRKEKHRVLAMRPKWIVNVWGIIWLN